MYFKLRTFVNVVLVAGIMAYPAYMPLRILAPDGWRHLAIWCFAVTLIGAIMIGRSCGYFLAGFMLGLLYGPAAFWSAHAIKAGVWPPDVSFDTLWSGLALFSAAVMAINALMVAAESARAGRARTTADTRSSEFLAQFGA